MPFNFIGSIYNFGIEKDVFQNPAFTISKRIILRIADSARLTVAILTGCPNCSDFVFNRQSLYSVRLSVVISLIRRFPKNERRLLI
jgi:hypothetical protein